MNRRTRRTALRMISYGVYLLGAACEEQTEVATITWLTPASFAPPLLVVGLKKTGRPYSLIAQSGAFAVSFPGREQPEMARAFLRDVTVDGDRIGGYRFERASSGAPILIDAMAWIEARVLSADERGDHAMVIAEVVGAGVRRKETPLALRDLGLFYGG